MVTPEVLVIGGGPAGLTAPGLVFPVQDQDLMVVVARAAGTSPSGCSSAERGAAVRCQLVSGTGPVGW